MKIDIIKRTNSNYKKKILIIGVFHGDEPQGEYFINSYLNKSAEKLACGGFCVETSRDDFSFSSDFIEDKNPTLKNEVYYIPRLNQNNSRKNKNGVDLNRNFPTKNWIKNDKYIKNDENQNLESNNYFGGEKPQSEEETRFLVDLIEKNKFDAIITIHSPYKVINYDGPAEELALAIKKFLNYEITSDIGYPTPGSFGTYCGIERKIPTITIEIDEEEDIEELNKKFSKLFEFLENEY